MKKYSIIIILFTLLSSCDCYQKIQGVVVQKGTDLPIKGARIYNKDKTYNQVLSDSTGYFEISNISGGFKCPPLSIVIEKEQYITQAITVKHSQTDTVRIEMSPVNK